MRQNGRESMKMRARTDHTVGWKKILSSTKTRGTLPKSIFFILNLILFNGRWTARQIRLGTKSSSSDFCDDDSEWWMVVSLTFRLFCVRTFSFLVDSTNTYSTALLSSKTTLVIASSQVLHLSSHWFSKIGLRIVEKQGFRFSQKGSQQTNLLFFSRTTEIHRVQ